MDNLKEIRVDRKEIYDGRVLHFFVDTVRLPSGELATRELCEHIGAVAVIALTDDKKVIKAIMIAPTPETRELVI